MSDPCTDRPAPAGASTTLTDGTSDGSSPAWTEPKRRHWPRLIRRAIPMLALSGLIAWSFWELRGIGERKPLAASVQEFPLPEDMSFSTTAEEPAPEENGDASYGELIGVKVPEFLKTDVETWAGEGTVLKPIAASVPPWRSITLVNLWATWCGPCKEELPGLRKLFEDGRTSRGWGPETRFIALMVDDSKPSRVAHREFLEAMPTNAIFLVDRGLGGGVKSKLTATKIPRAERIKRNLMEATLLPEESSLPVTLLLDCRRRVRWHHVGMLEEDDFEVISEQIDALREELGTPACRPKDPPIMSVKRSRSEPEGAAFSEVSPPRTPPLPAEPEDKAAADNAAKQALLPANPSSHKITRISSPPPPDNSHVDCFNDADCPSDEKCSKPNGQRPRCAVLEMKVSP